MLQRLKDFREDKDISQKKMAEILNVAQTTYSDYELGKINIPLNTLKKLALFFDTRSDYVMEVTDVSKTYPRKK